MASIPAIAGMLAALRLVRRLVENTGLTHVPSLHVRIGCGNFVGWVVRRHTRAPPGPQLPKQAPKSGDSSPR
jgi:hypothetical protein